MLFFSYFLNVKNSKAMKLHVLSYVNNFWFIVDDFIRLAHKIYDILCILINRTVLAISEKVIRHFFNGKENC